MLNLFKKSPQAQIIFVFDIGSSDVRGAVAKIQKGGHPEILYTTESTMSLKREIDSKNFLEAASKALKQTAERLAHEGIQHLNFSGNRNLPRSYHCFLSSPWIVSETKILKLEKENMVFTPALLASIVGKEEEDFKNASVSKYKATVRNDARLLEKKVTEIRLNGYPTTKPFGKPASNVSLALYLSMAGDETINTFSEIIKNTFSLEKGLKFHSFSLAASSVVSDTLDEDDYLLLDITGEISDITAVRCGIISESASFPIAENGLLRGLSKKFATTKEEAQSLLKMRSDNSLSQGMSSKVNDFCTLYGREFIHSLQSSLEMPFGGKVFIAANHEIEADVQNWLKEMPSLKPIILSNKLLGKFIKKQNDASVFTALEILFVSKILNLH